MTLFPADSGMQCSVWFHEWNALGMQAGRKPEGLNVERFNVKPRSDRFKKRD